MPNCPSHWHSTSLAGLAHYFNGVAFKPKDWGLDGLPIIRIEQINDPSAVTDRYSGPLLEQNRITDGDLVFSWSATLAVVLWRGGPAALNQHLFKVVPNPGTDKSFLLHLLDVNMDKLGSSSQGSTMRHVTRRELSRFKVCVPPTECEQKQIGAVLDSISDQLDSIERSIAKHDRIKAGLIHDLFTRGLDANGSLRPPHGEGPELYKSSCLGLIPKSWNVQTLSELAAPFRGAVTIGPFGSDLLASDYRDEGVPVIFVRDVKEDGLHWISETYVSQGKSNQLSAHKARPGDLIATKMGLPPCLACVYPNDFPEGIITADIIRTGQC